ncbi:hypothetical protein RA19_23095 [Leisingera sp. ANG-M1]|uniref:LysR family transcriptional regulator n=1 Tax=Leisingera sp. ANG-M1 TaxID=1577895 RepID=UPI00057D8003|nr:LysR family transcriptional regulator [Leisingera sp. ANG-M1]KIC07674.1 hypothetical protein RA19_23095 [Leisingera sp. ANG-M1]
MDMFAAMRVVTEVARLGSFAAASTELRLSAASVSRVVADLEADLGVRLINRTTRQMNLTDAGLEFVQRSSGLLEEVANMRNAVHERHAAPRGRLRVSCVAAFGNECLAPVLPEFMDRFPELEVSLEISNRTVDLIEEHFDVAIRVGPLQDSSLVAKKIFSQKVVFVATPEFFRQYGVPKSLEEIRSLPSVTQISGEWGRSQRFTYETSSVEFEAPQRCTVSSSVAAKNAALSGNCYTMLGDFMVASDISENRLVRLLPEYKPVEQPIYAVYPQRHYLPQKTRVFVDYLSQKFSV